MGRSILGVIPHKREWGNGSTAAHEVLLLATNATVANTLAEGAFTNRGKMSENRGHGS
jgi:hypothetical protein